MGSKCSRPRSFIIIRTLSPAGSFLRSRAHGCSVSGMPIAWQNSACVMSPFNPLHRTHEVERFSITLASTRRLLGTRCSTVRLDLDPQ